MKYYWDSKDLRRDLMLLKRKLKEETDFTKKEFLYDALCSLKKIIINEESEVEQLNLENLAEVCDIVPAFDRYYPYFEKFRSKLYRSYSLNSLEEIEKDVPRGEEEKIKLSNDDINELINEFFKSTNREFYDTYTKLYKDRYSRIRFSDKSLSSYMLFSPYVNKAYVEIGEQEDVEKLVSLAHEEGHSVASLMNPERYISEDFFFREIEAIFFDMLASQYFGKELNASNFYKKMNDNLESYYFEAEDILDYKRLAEVCFSQGNPSEDDLVLTDRNLQDTLEDLLYNDCSIANQVKYGFSYIVAIELFELYQKDKEEALGRLKQIITSKNPLEHQTIIETVTPNKSLIKYKNRITRLNK